MKRLPTSNEFVSVYEDGSVEFSQAGIEKYRALFGRAGFNILLITDYQAYHQAMRAIRPYEYNDLLATLSAKNPTYKTESALLEAVLEQDDAATDYLSDQLQRRKQAGFKLITNKKKPD